MDTMSNVTAIGVVVALIEVIKQLITHFVTKKDESSEKINEIYELLKKTDVNGVPLCYHQKNISEIQQIQTLDAIKTTMERISIVQENFMTALEKIVVMLEKINDRQMFESGRDSNKKS